MQLIWEKRSNGHFKINCPLFIFSYWSPNQGNKVNFEPLSGLLGPSPSAISEKSHNIACDAILSYTRYFFLAQFSCERDFHFLKNFVLAHFLNDTNFILAHFMSHSIFIQSLTRKMCQNKICIIQKMGQNKIFEKIKISLTGKLCQKEIPRVPISNGICGI